MTPKHDHHRPAVVLSGGGANGAFEVGVLKALTEGESPATDYRPLELDVISGTSVGGFNSSVLTSHYTAGSVGAVEALKDVWLNVVADTANKCGNGVYRFRGDPGLLLDPGCLLQHPLFPLTTLTRDAAFFARDAVARTADFLTSRGSLTDRLISQINLADFIDVTRFHETIDHVVDLPAIRAAAWTLFVTSSNWTKGVPRVFRNSDFTDELGPLIVAASAAIPGVFPPVTIEGDEYVDGGLLANTPVMPPYLAGASELHVVFVDPTLAEIQLPPLADTMDTLYRGLIILWATAIAHDIERIRSKNRSLALLQRAAGHDPSSPRRVPVHTYRPRHELGGFIDTLNFGKDRIEQLMQLGYDAAVNHDCEVEGCNDHVPSDTGHPVASFSVPELAS